MKSPNQNTDRTNPRAGFAIVVSLSVMALMVLLILTMTTLVRVETGSSTSGKQQLAARQQALLGLQMALGELQVSMGPDQRVSATAEILNSSDPSRRNIVGVWSTEDINDAELKAKTTTPAPIRVEPTNWLASDAKDANRELKPQYAASAVDTVEGVVLVGAGSLPDLNFDGEPDDLNDQVIVDTTDTTVEQNGQIVGRFAWWIGDEGTKARINRGSGLDRTTPVTEQKFRSLNAATAFTQSIPSALAGFEEIDFERDAERIYSLADLELLPESGDELNKRYFHHLSTYSAGILTDVRNGGLKKDLSLAFEMDDPDFNNSEFADAGEDAFKPWDSRFGPEAPFKVTPVFFLDVEPFNPGTVSVEDAHGPTWHVLRDYYRIYHDMRNPMRNPAFKARVFGPNLRHPDYDLSKTDSLKGGGEQPAYVYSGGIGYEQGGNNRNDNQRNKTPGWIVSNMRPTETGRMLFSGPQNDPLRSRDGSIPAMLSGSYMPIMIRAVNEVGMWFKWDPLNPGDANGGGGGGGGGSGWPFPGGGGGGGGTVNTDAYRGMLASRSVYVFHNPYNVALSHNFFTYELEGFEATVRAYNINTRYEAETPQNKDGNSNTADKWGTNNSTRQFNRAAVEPGTFRAGEIKAYEGVETRGSERSRQLTGSAGARWQGVKNPNMGANQNDIGSRLAPGGYTFVVRGREANRNNTIHANFGGSLDHGEKTALLVSEKTLGNHYFQTPGAPGLKSGEMRKFWPVASSFGSGVVGPGKDYRIARQLGSNLTSEFRYPMEDSSFNDTQPIPEYHFGQTMHVPRSNLDVHTASVPLSIRVVDFQLKPAEYRASSGLDARYPVYAMTNPIAPVKDSRGFLPAAELTKFGSVGYPTFSPGWDYNVGVGVDTVSADYATWGPTDGALDAPYPGVDNATILELPTSPVLSIGKLQHANIAIYDHMPALAIGNSFASPFIARDQVYALNENRYGHQRVFYDMSYLMNEALWDGYFFSSYSIPYDADADDYDTDRTTVKDSFDNAFNSPDPTPLPNPRMKLSMGNEGIEDVGKKLFEGDRVKADGYLRSAENLVVEGAFNVNSTSVEAWQTVLTGARNMQIYLANSTDPELLEDAVPVLRLSQPPKPELLNLNLIEDEAWGGFRTFTDNQIAALASNIVEEIKLRANTPNRVRITAAPFLSMSEFVNRRLTDSTDETGLSGVLQAAIDKTRELGNHDFEDPYNQIPDDVLHDSQFAGSDNKGFPYRENLKLVDGGSVRDSSTAMSAPTYLLQADILQALGSFLAVRSDCFRIRSYGEHTDPVTGETLSRAWCEAIVLRYADPVEPRNGTNRQDAEYWSAKDSDGEPTPFGRKFKIIAFNWLSEDEV